MVIVWIKLGKGFLSARLRRGARRRLDYYNFSQELVNGKEVLVPKGQQGNK